MFHQTPSSTAYFVCIEVFLLENQCSQPGSFRTPRSSVHSGMATSGVSQVEVFVNVDGNIQKCEPSAGSPGATCGGRWSTFGGCREVSEAWARGDEERIGHQAHMEDLARDISFRLDS